MSVRSLAEEVEGTAPPPCDGCEHTRFCATHEVACEMFYLYTTKGGNRGRIPDRVPCNEFWVKTFERCDEPTLNVNGHTRPCNKLRVKNANGNYYCEVHG